MPSASAANRLEVTEGTGGVEAIVWRRSLSCAPEYSRFYASVFVLYRMWSLWLNYLRSRVENQVCQDAPNQIATVSRFHKLWYTGSPQVRSQKQLNALPTDHS